jgi:hypothetical protein
LAYCTRLSSMNGQGPPPWDKKKVGNRVMDVGSPVSQHARVNYRAIVGEHRETVMVSKSLTICLPQSSRGRRSRPEDK